MYLIEAPVEQRHIDKQSHSPMSCPVALALIEATGCTVVVELSMTMLYPRDVVVGKEAIRLRPSAETKVIIASYDNNQVMTPFVARYMIVNY